MLDSAATRPEIRVPLTTQSAEASYCVFAAGGAARSSTSPFCAQEASNVAAKDKPTIGWRVMRFSLCNGAPNLPATSFDAARGRFL